MYNRQGYGKIHTTLNKDKELLISPHYSDDRFKEEQTVFGEPANSQYGHKHLTYVYSDRIWQWDSDKAKESVEVANESGVDNKTCRWYEIYLSHYYDKEIVIEHIISGVNRSSGYPYNVFGFRDRE